MCRSTIQPTVLGLNKIFSWPKDLKALAEYDSLSKTLKILHLIMATGYIDSE